MKKNKTFIYYEKGKEYFQKTITLKSKRSREIVEVKDIHIDLKNSNIIDKIIKNLKITQEMKKIVADKNVTLYSTDFNIGCVIVSSGGVILANDIPFSIGVKAGKNRENRLNAINQYFGNYRYRRARTLEFEGNHNEINNLINMQLDFIIGTYNVNDGDYIRLLDCLIECTEPFKSEYYEKRVKKLLKEYPSK